MASNTPRAGFIKPTTLEPRAVGPLNSNSDRNDELLGAFLINDGASIPDAQAMDGMIVKEKTSGKMWVLQKNVGGTFDKKYINYPWSFLGFTTSTAQANGAWTERGIQNFGGSSIGAGGGSVNSSSADLVSTRVVLPIKGIYSIRFHTVFDANNAGVRGGSINFNAIAAAQDNNTNVVVNAAQSTTTSFNTITEELCPAGTQVSINLFQNSGGSLNVSFQVFINLIAPVA